MKKKNDKRWLIGALTVGLLSGSFIFGAVPVNAVTEVGEHIVVAEAKAYDYILWNSDGRYLSTDEIYALSAYEMKLARNEIYARHGRKFKTKAIQDYFDEQEWYLGTIDPDKFNEDVLNKYETSNIALIKKCEKAVEDSSTKSNSYILPNSNSSYLKYKDIQDLSAYDLRLARNEIYARHGRRFRTKKIQTYFDSKSWYSGTIRPDDFDENVLNKYEQSNIEFIKSYENKSASNTKTSNDYILPESSSKYLIYDNIAYLSSYELRLARNEIYARRGRKFKTKKIQAYFDSQSWYNGTIDADDFDDDKMLSDIEKANINFIKSYE